MKTLKSFLLGLTLMVVGIIAKADEPEAAKLSKNYAIATYINAMAQGKTEGLDNVLDQSAKFSMLRGKKVLSFSKTDMLNFMNSNANIAQNCTVNTSVVEKESNNDVSVIKVDMQYTDFVRSNYVTVTNTGNGWKITNVYTVFK
ncbi:hypothetical protein HH214_17070 [Mucilaginibacter robiniae]|uniref:Nuclear transport factor 2 family protein n=1 Tax=Mucilaginibacter robiniae TaxID=2728022 RepID=A0A7L5E2E8_9SPHI|nr:nuclear transport factor 2 family protein [Mucilaginibacter robiniae]QJD97462.1 hypothetical protein HH214_17070 [Mucilaginibacter robiniae]